MEWAVLPSPAARAFVFEWLHGVSETWDVAPALCGDLEPILAAALEPRLERHNEEMAAASLGGTFWKPVVLRAADYCVQCVGIIRDGTQLVFLNGCHRTFAEKWPADWRSTPLKVMDGGRKFFRAEYNPVSGQITYLRFNGPVSA